MLFPLAVFLTIAGFYVATPNGRFEFPRFGPEDSECYLSLARNMASGRGYSRSLPPAPALGHKCWPPGLPTLMLPAAASSSERFNFWLAKITMCLVGLAGAVALWALVRRLSGDALVADLAGLLILLNPTYWDFSHHVMTEVPMIAWVFGGLLLIDFIWARRYARPWEAAGVGLVCGLAMMMKGSSFALGLAPLAYLGGARRSLLNGRQFLIVFVCYGLGFATPQGLWMLRNQTVEAHGHLDGADQLLNFGRRDLMDTSSERISLAEMAANALSNLRQFVIYNIPQQILPGLWHRPFLDWKGSGLLALPLTACLLLLAVRARWATVGLHLVLWPIALITIIMPPGGAPRYWTPIALLLLPILAIQYGSRLALTGRKLAVIGMLLAVNLGAYVAQRQPYFSNGAWHELAELFHQAADLDLTDGNVFTTNFRAFNLVTGYSATDPSVHESALYTHIVLRTDVAENPTPQGSRILLAVPPLILVELPEAVSGRELQNRYKTLLSSPARF